jgi:hypothetical protein
MQVAAMGAGEGRILDQFDRRVGIAEHHLHHLVAAFAGLGRLRVRRAERQERSRLFSRAQQGRTAKRGGADTGGPEKNCSAIHRHPPNPCRVI